MKFFYIVFVVLVFGAYAGAQDSSDIPVDALIQKESGGDDNAVGDAHLKSKAYGCLQIRQPCVDDYNRWHKVSYKAEDMLGNRPLSIAVCKDYIDHYATPKRLGRAVTIDDKIRIWNGGPNGWRKDSTLAYCEDVKRIILERS